MKKYALIVAGGKGMRMNSDLPKQFIPIGGKPVLMCTIEIFKRYDKTVDIILVLPALQIPFWQELCRKHHFTIPHIITEGGETRFHSVKNGLEKTNHSGLVAVHDGVRPFVSIETIERCFDEASRSGNAVPVTEPVDSIRKVEGEKNFAVNRADYRLVQTPQVFDVEKLKASYNKVLSDNANITHFTDDASVFAYAGYDIRLVEGNRENIKITTEFDLRLAECLVSEL